MALQRAPQLGGDFLDLKDLARGGPVLAVFKINEFCQPEAATGFAGTNVPVVADVLIASGPRAGEVVLGERLIGAITAPLRGVRNPNAQKGIGVQNPVNQVGAEIVVRLKLVIPGKGNEGVVGDQPSEPETATVEQLYNAMGGEALWAQAAARAAAQAGVAPSASPAQYAVPATVLSTATGAPVVHQVDVPAEPTGADQAALAAQLAALQAQLAAAQAGQQPAAVGAGASNGADAGGERPVWQPAQ